MNRSRKAVVMLATLAVATAGLARQPQETNEREAKAKFLANAPTFVEWPEAAFPSPNTPLLICVHGDFSFGTTLAELTRGEVVRRRRLEVRWIRGEQSLNGCQVVFVTHSLAKKYATVLESVKDSGALTIGEDPEFLKAGGMVDLEESGKGLTFDVNLDAVARVHLKISSQLLSLARRVLRDAEPTSS